MAYLKLPYLALFTWIHITVLQVINVRCHYGHQRQYLRPANVTLGAILPVHVFDSQHPCGIRLRDINSIQTAEAIVFAISQVNADPNILPNLTLGFVILDDCAKDTTALENALAFMPKRMRTDNGRCSIQCSPDSPGDSMFHDVIGVIGAESSPSTIMMANVLSAFKIPQISPTATSDTLSDTNRFPFFMRMVPPDRYQVSVIVDVLRYFNWTYVSVVYSEGGYGAKAAEHFKDVASSNGICIGNMQRVSPAQDISLFSDVVNSLAMSSAKVVVLFADQEETKYLFSAVKKASLIGYFVWVGSDGLAFNIDDLDEFSNVALGALAVKAYSEPVTRFQEHFEKLNPVNNNGNPWIKEMWEYGFNCSWNDSSMPACSNFSSIVESPAYKPSKLVSIFIDTVHVFAKALHKFIEEVCPVIPPAGLEACNNFSQYFQFMKTTNFTGEIGPISFDDKGDLIGRYEILNVRPDGKSAVTAVRVGVWDSRTLELEEINLTGIYWPDSHAAVPKSWCGQECTPGQVYTYTKDTCCWECRNCSANQRTASNATKCQPCEQFTWPAAPYFTTCEPIPAEHLTWSDPLVVIMAVAAVCGVLGCLGMLAVYVSHNEARVIKATSRELSYIMLFGLLSQYGLVFSLLSLPTTASCHSNFIGFNLSFALVYAPLMVKTNRIYRIFNAGRRTIRLPSCTSPPAQVVITMSFISIQVILNTVVVIRTPPAAIPRMPVATKRFVELMCDFPLDGMIGAVCYNLFLVVICTYYAFKTRGLPDTYNESRHISLCVYTTLIIWLAFLPTYFTTSRAYYRVVLLSSALLFNGTAIVMCLYAPKVLALYRKTEKTCDKETQMQSILSEKNGNPRSSTGKCVDDLTDLNPNDAPQAASNALS